MRRALTPIIEMNNISAAASDRMPLFHSPDAAPANNNFF
jgi:hypothetical protein